LAELSGHDRLSRIFSISKASWFRPDQWGKSRQSKAAVDQLLFKHYLGSHIGYQTAKNLLQQRDVDFGHIVNQIESYGPQQLFAGMDRHQVYKAFQRGQETAANSKLKRRMGIAGIGATAVLLGALGLSIGADKVRSHYAEQVEPPTAKMAQYEIQQRPSKGATTPEEPHLGAGNYFLKLAGKYFPDEHHPNFAISTDVLHAALMQGRALDQGWAVDTGNGTRLIQNRETRRAMEQEAERLARKLKKTLQGVGPAGFRPVKSNKPGMQYDEYLSVRKLGIAMGLKESTAEKVASSVTQLKYPQRANRGPGREMTRR
jgi:hypothetical protein